ncbi:unnamed protein product [Polarella glacialis]|uniref:Isopenicillin N synthase-like Fe(2+) 2OG dioxygenase domain-containing protein n=1 Tax=Polarella glacialis TaxID=89957 RepID=A0A813GD81_POLGL|nr:unnamed protein product [Polarella glacialis]
MSLLTISMAALARGCSLEMQLLNRGLRGPGFFACGGHDMPAGSEVLVDAYAASRRLHNLRPNTSIRKKPSTNPLRWWFTAVEERPWPGEKEDPEAANAIRKFDAQLAGVAAVLAGAATIALNLRCQNFSGGSGMLRGLRYARQSSADGELGIPAHVDFGDFTLCHSEQQGLEVWERETSEWHALPPGQLYFLAAAGLERKSKGEVHAVQHRVSQSQDTERLSFCRLHGVPAALRK